MRRSKVLQTILVAFLATGILGTSQASETGHYVNGVEGLKCGTVPGPGVYLRNYMAFYNANELTDDDGDRVDIDFDLEVAACVSRMIWITPKKIFGADYGVQVVVAGQGVNLEIDPLGVKDSDTAWGDLDISPLILSWHKPRWDLALAYDLFVPSGTYSINAPASSGKDMFTHMFTLGATGYLDAAKSWHASILARYEIHHEKEETEVTPGDDFHFEWGVGKTFKKFWDVGVVGYCQWQVSDDEGAGVTWDRDVHDRVFAIGPELSYFHAPWKMQFSLRHEWEFGAHDRSEGHITNFTMMKVF